MEDFVQQEKKGLLEFDINIKGVSSTQKLVFARYLAVMLKSGLTISEALDIIYDQSTGKFKKIIFSILRSVQSGNSLSDSLRKYPNVFSDLFINTAYAGESSGTLDKNLDNIAIQLKGEKELATKIKSAMVYPIIVIAATGILGLAMAFLVLPKITPLFEGMDMDLPITTKMLIWVSHQIQSNGWSILVGLSVFLFSFFWLIRQRFAKPVTDFIILKTPIIKKISYNVNLARFSRTLATLLKSGLNIDEALNITKDTVSNYYYKKVLAKISKRISQGSTLSNNMSNHERYFPKLVISMIKVGERSGNLEESLFYLAEFYDAEVDSATKTLSTAIEPILLIGIGLAVGVMAMSIVTPIYQITGNINQ